ncbi:PREDICTED: uncharacterized protein LOC109241980 [Nicotiana attenuata]|uniref:uncharacterized protein LOC109241980 n=1 Tax=Nicotiana attenuata TaxID=49451 RepID=UPI000905104F|nr:PREDICTED: uncharacterized protein LOC109241980 [Nicotiana attenuata]
MDITRPLPRSVKVQDPKGRLIQQEVVYDWEPTYCSKFLKIGHDSTVIRKEQPQRMIQQRKVATGKQAWLRTDRNGANEKKETEQKEMIETAQQRESEPTEKEVQRRDEGWITVLGRSAARAAKARQNEEQEVAGKQEVQSLNNNINYDVPAPGWQWISNANPSNKSRIWVIWDPRIYKFDPEEADEQLDRQHGTEVQDIETRDFKEFLLDTGMHELQYMGRNYTRTNNHTSSRIDRGLVLEPLVSDHSPLKLMITQKVEQAWEERSTGGMMQIVWNKLKKVKEVIKEINTKHYKGVDERIKRIREELQSTQKEMSSNLQRQDLIEKEKTLKGDLEKWILIEESIYRQRSRVQWLKLGDSNSANFFAQMKNRSNLNGIQFLTNDMGDQLVLEDDIEAEIMGYYKKLLGSSAESLPAINPNDMKMGPVLNREQQLLLIKQVSKE